jgi:LysM repeat protein
MLYFVRPGDTLFGISRRFGTTVSAIVRANVICNPNLIFVGQPLIIPTPGLELPLAGGGPYYVILPGDTLFCLSRYFGTSIGVLAAINQLGDPNLIFAGGELLVVPNEVPNPRFPNLRFTVFITWELSNGPPWAGGLSPTCWICLTIPVRWSGYLVWKPWAVSE